MNQRVFRILTLSLSHFYSTIIIALTFIKNQYPDEKSLEIIQYIVLLFLYAVITLLDKIRRSEYPEEKPAILPTEPFIETREAPKDADVVMLDIQNATEQN